MTDWKPSTDDLESLEAAKIAFKQGNTHDDVIKFYREWVKGGKYMKDTEPVRYRAHILACEDVEKYFPENRDKVKVIDIGAGTGRAGVLLIEKGFKNMDALEPCEDMLREAKKLKIYNKHFCIPIGFDRLPIEDNAKDKKGNVFGAEEKKITGKKSAAKKNSRKEIYNGDHSYSKEAVHAETPTLSTTIKDDIVEDRPEVDIQSSQENELQSTITEEDKHWDVPWKNFFTEDVSAMDLQSAEAYEETDTVHFANEHYVVHKIFKFSPNDDLDEVELRLRTDRRYQVFRSLQENLQKRFNVIGNFRVSKCTDNVIQLIWLYDVDVPSDKFGLNMTLTLATTLYVHRIVLDPDHDFWIGLPKPVMSIANLERIASKLESWDVCTGNYETEYVNTMSLSTTAHDISNNALEYREDTYDLAIVSGAMGEGHIPCEGLHEMARIVKPGGLISVSMRNEFMEMCTDYIGRLEPLMKKMEEDGEWKLVSRNIRPNYYLDKPGLVLKFSPC